MSHAGDSERVDRLTWSLRWLRERAWVSVGVALLLELGTWLVFRKVDVTRWVGVVGALGSLIGLVVALVNGPLAGCLVALGGGSLFVGLMAYHGTPRPALFGIPVVLVWLGVAATGGIVADSLRRRTALALSLAEAARQEAVAARARAEHLAARALNVQRMTAGLAEAVTVVDVARVIVEAGLEATDATGGLLAVLDEHGTALRVAGSIDPADGWNAEPGSNDAAGGARHASTAPPGEAELMPLDVPFLLTEPLRTRTGVFVGSVAECRERFPAGVGSSHLEGAEAWSAVPLIGSRPLGVLAFSYGRARRFEPPDRDALVSLASQCAQALERAALYEGERRVAEVLQQSLLPDRVPDVPSIRTAARYLAGGPDVEVGGDWYDVLDLPNGRLGVAIGDVVGRGTRAAAVMGHFRTALRAYALAHEDPGAAMSALSEHLMVYGEVDLATLLYATLDPVTGLLRYASAGHPPALVRDADGSTRFLSGVPLPPLGVGEGTRYVSVEDTLLEGSCAVLYTDGLIERRGESLDAGLDRLAAAVQDGPEEPEALCGHLLEALLGGRDRADDVALVVLARDPAPLRLRLELPARPAILPGLRRQLRSWMERQAISADTAGDVLLAVSEAANNAIAHAYAAGEGTFEVDLGLDGSDLVAVVRDQGTWRERGGPAVTVAVAARAAPAGAAPHGGGRPDASADSGRGLHLMRATMDDLTVERSDRGTSVRMRRRVGAAP